jgi:glutaminyl-tRNA synthetase
VSDAGSNFLVQIIEDDLRSGRHDHVVTRFPPEPNGYLHIGHAKAIVADFGLAARYGGRCHLRFDDTNPVKEDPKYADAIQHDIRWLGFDWGEHLYWASDYFQQLYDWAVLLVEQGKAYVDESSEEEIRELRGTVESPGTPSRWRDRPVAESLQRLDEMRRGVHPDGAMVLRAKIDLANPNMKLRDPLMYRIRNVEHPRTGDTWHIYPFYDYAHGLSDAIEGITHSMCSLEFDNNRAIYDWFVDNLPTPSRPHQYEWARLNLHYTVLSKRKLIQLVDDGHVWGWDDPRMPTIAGLRRRGYTPASIRSFVERVGVSKAANATDPLLLENAIRDDLNDKAPRYMAVLDPLEVVVTSWPEGDVDTLDASLWPHDVPKEGTRPVPFTRRLYVERSDFAEQPPKGWRRMAPGVEVRLRYGYLVTVDEVVRDDAGEVVRLHVTHDPASRGGVSPDGRKVKGTIHWVSADKGVRLPVRQFDRLFRVAEPGKERPFLDDLNPDALRELNAVGEPALASVAPGEHVQLERTGYFFADPVDSAPGAPVFHRTVPLKDSWGKASKPAAAPKAAATTPATVAPAAPSVPKELPPEVVARADDLVGRFPIDRKEAELVALDEQRVAFFEAAAAHGPPATVAKWLVNVLAGEVDDLGSVPFAPDAFGTLATRVDDGTLSSRLGKDVLARMLATGDGPDAIIEAEGLAMMSGAALRALVDEVVAAHPDKASAYRGGRTNLVGFFMGQVMRRSGGKADPERAKELLAEVLS